MMHTDGPRRTWHGYRLIGGATLLAGALTLTACNTDNSLARSFGPDTAGGSELRLGTRPPLSMPPEFSRRPERAGVSRPAAPADVATGTTRMTATAGTGSMGQDALLSAAGPPAASNIRARLAEDAQFEATDPRTTDEIMTWQRPADQPAVIQRGPTSGFWSRIF